jgi:23S rRNA maturation-related 3'-5' exoribonuclease YhaM
MIQREAIDKIEELVSASHEPTIPVAPLDPVTCNHIAHIIASHHEQREWGAAQVPMTREEFMFHCLDMMDARYELMSNLLAAGVNADGLTPFDYSLSCAPWNPTKGGLQ